MFFHAFHASFSFVKEKKIPSDFIISSYYNVLLNVQFRGKFKEILFLKVYKVSQVYSFASLMYSSLVQLRIKIVVCYSIKKKPCKILSLASLNKSLGYFFAVNNEKVTTKRERTYLSTASLYKGTEQSEKLLLELSPLFLCLERCTNEAKGSIQCRIDPFASLACQTADNCDKSYFEPTSTMITRSVQSSLVDMS